MVQIRWENISEKAQIFHFPKLIEILQCDRYFLKKVKICPLGGLIHAHHGTWQKVLSWYKTISVASLSRFRAI